MEFKLYGGHTIGLLICVARGLRPLETFHFISGYRTSESYSTTVYDLNVFGWFTLTSQYSDSESTRGHRALSLGTSSRFAQNHASAGYTD